MEYLATFHTHYGAMRYERYCREHSMPAKVLAVPRTISASCGICVRFTAQVQPEVSEHEDMDRCYIIGEDEEYKLVEG
ncbi:MAG: DUF3343 domain-containing protein [Treponema sp.]|jgi:hypothetical protein|nr:DUF3343 domain-containing protein [Treponema sp.]